MIGKYADEPNLPPRLQILVCQTDYTTLFWKFIGLFFWFYKNSQKTVDGSVIENKSRQGGGRGHYCIVEFVKRAGWHSGYSALSIFSAACDAATKKLLCSRHACLQSLSRLWSRLNERFFLKEKSFEAAGSPTKIKEGILQAGAFFYFGGREWIRTTEARRNRFTVCPLWPLGNSPIGAGERSRTINLLITSQLLCHWATPASWRCV